MEMVTRSSDAGSMQRVLPALSLIIAVCLPPAAVCAPAVGVVVARPPSTLPKGAEEAFRLGVSESVDGVASGTRPPPISPARLREVKAADRALEEGRAAYLDVQLEAAEKHLSHAVNLYFADPTTLPDADPASQAALLLAEVRSMLKRAEPSNAALQRAFSVIPGFPRGSPPPSLSGRIDRVRRRLMRSQAARLEIVTEPPGTPVRVNGALVGRSPVTIEGPIRGEVRVRAERPSGATQERIVLLGPTKIRVHFVEHHGQARQNLGAALVAGHSARTWRGARKLQGTLGADETCVALVDGHGNAIIARLDGRRRIVRGGHVTSSPSHADDWRALGRFCSADAQSNRDAVELEELLWPPFPLDETSGDAFNARGAWGWGAVALAGGAAGLGAWLGMTALKAEEDYDAADTRAQAGDAADRARMNAKATDVTFAVALGLLGAGVYLLTTDSAPAD